MLLLIIEILVQHYINLRDMKKLFKVIKKQLLWNLKIR